MAVQYNNRLRGRTVMVLPASCPQNKCGYYGELQTQSRNPRHSSGLGCGHKLLVHKDLRNYARQSFVARPMPC